MDSIPDRTKASKNGLDKKNRELMTMVIKSFSGQSNLLTVPRLYIDLAGGDIYAALFLSQCIYWSDYTKTGWFYKTQEDWAGELGDSFTYYQIKKCSSYWERFKVLETDLKKAHGAPTVHYRVDIDNLIRLIEWGIDNGFSNISKMDFEKISKSDFEKISNSLTLNYNNNTTQAEGEPVEGKQPRTTDQYKASIMAAMQRGASRQALEQVDLSWLQESLRPYALTFLKGVGSDYVILSKEHSFWRKTLQDWQTLGLEQEDIARAIRHMTKEGLTIGGPQSVTKIARSLKVKAQDDQGQLPIFEM